MGKKSGSKPPWTKHAQELLGVFVREISLLWLFPADSEASKAKRENTKPKSMVSGFQRSCRAWLQGEIRMVKEWQMPLHWAEIPAGKVARA